MARCIKPTPIPVQTGPMTPKLLGDIVRSKRTRLGLGLHDAAMLCNVSISTLSKIETAKGDVILERTLHVCEKLGVNLTVTNDDENE